jgi:mono/diheme cytochrome c family protein
MILARIAAAVLGAACLAGAGMAQGADIARGAEVYRRHCANCHGSSGEGAWPGTPNFSRREGLLRTDQALLQTLRTGRGAKPGFQGMLSDADLLNVIAFCRTLPR